MVGYPLYTDDERMICEMIDREWSIPFDKPNLYYRPIALARNNLPGSIFVYDMGRSFPTPRGINYEQTKRNRRLSIDIQTPENRERHFAYVNEVIRILMKYRRAGPDRLGGWEYLELGNISDRQGYVNFYHTVAELNLVVECSPLSRSGFGLDCRPCDERPCPPQEHRQPEWNPEGRGSGVGPTPDSD